MFNLLLSWFSPESIVPKAEKQKNHKKRFGIIPIEPCRISSMQMAWNGSQTC